MTLIQTHTHSTCLIHCTLFFTEMEILKTLSFFCALEIVILWCVVHGKIYNSPSNDWGIQVDSIQSVGYSFEEFTLDAPVGTILAEYPVEDVGTASLEEPNEFIKLQLVNNSQFLQFILTKPLTDFRKEQWAASMEIEYRITCAEAEEDIDSSKTHTFMLIIRDCNAFPPIFNPTESRIMNNNSIDAQFNVTLPWPESLPIIKKGEILVLDRDINIKYANITVSCVEVDNSTKCDNFDINVKHLESINGHTYTVEMYFTLTSEINNLKTMEKEGSTFSIGLEASDSIHNVTQIINFLTTKVSEGSGGSDYGSSKFPIAEVVGTGSAVAVLVVIAFTYTTWQNRKTKNILRKLTEQEIREFLDGAGFTGAVPKRSVDCNTPILAMPYNRAFEIPRDRLRIDETTVLGSGFFGVVMKGSILQENGESIIVAVKAVKRNVGVLYFKALLSELKIMAFIKQHSNIVSLIGACTHNIRKREVYIAVEFCSNGNLHNYLRAYRTSFVNLVKDGKLCGVRFRGSDASNRKWSDSHQISTLDLIKWSTQIASGLDYLSSLGVIHGDLATRNVLLSSERVAKIADFGLSRRLVDVSSYYYTKQSQAPLPWKWMSIESLKDMKFSTKSDIWSFGIVLWEIFTLGQTPYPGLNWDETFVDRLEKGLRLPQPQFSSTDMYNIMMDCWTTDPHHRPTAFDLKRILEMMTNSLLNQNSSSDGYFRLLGSEKFFDVGQQDSGISSAVDHESHYEEGLADC